VETRSRSAPSAGPRPRPGPRPDPGAGPRPGPQPGPGFIPRFGLRPGLRLVYDPSGAPVLADGDHLLRLDPVATRLLQRMDGHDGLPREADVLGPSPTRDDLSTWARLLRTGVVADVELPGRMVRDLDEKVRFAALAEATALVAEDPVSAEGRWRRRRTTSVTVVGCGATAPALLRLLARAGLGTTVAADAETLSIAPDVVVLAYDHEPPTDMVERLMREGRPHLVVAVRGVTGQVGPFVQPGRTPCLRCVDLTRSHTEHGWAGLREQLSRPARGPGAAAAARGTVVAAAVALAVSEVVAMIEGRVTVTGEATAVFGPGGPLPELRIWPLHPLCGCSWQA
jgi:hypothetical protein